QITPRQSGSIQITPRLTIIVVLRTTPKATTAAPLQITPRRSRLIPGTLAPTTIAPSRTAPTAIVAAPQQTTIERSTLITGSLAYRRQQNKDHALPGGTAGGAWCRRRPPAPPAEAGNSASRTADAIALAASPKGRESRSGGRSATRGHQAECVPQVG